MAPPSLAITPTWQVRIRAPDGPVAGGGVLVPDNQILTCTHVVNVALRRGEEPEPPRREPVHVDVPCGTEYRARTAWVVEASWDSERDTTLLALEGAPGQAPARLGARMDQIMEAMSAAGMPHEVRVQGYPRGTPEGLTTTARLIGPGGNIAHRAQVDIGRDQPVGFEPGFSGCGVLDTEDGSVIGILVSARYGGTGDDGHIGLMEPLEMVTPLADHLADAEFDALREVLGALRFEAVAEAYRAATRHRRPETGEFDTAWEAFTRLRQLTPRPDGLPCDIVFVEEVARIGVVNTAVLRSYTDTRPAEEVPADALDRLRGVDAPAPTVTGTLIVAAEPVPDDPGQPDRYTLSTWLDDGHTTINSGSMEVTGDGLREAVLARIEDAEARLPGPDDPAAPVLRLELILPFALLMERIAQWRLPAPMTGEGERIGASYEIVVHSRERLTEKGWERARHKLSERWARLLENGEGTVYGVAVGPGAGTDPSLQDRLADPVIVGCVLGGSPSLREGALQLGYALQSGVPAIAWIDTDDTEATRGFQNHIASMARPGADSVSRDDVVSLPRHVRKWRTESADSHVGSHGYDPYDTQLLLDDMSRIRRLFHTGILTTPK